MKPRTWLVLATVLLAVLLVADLGVGSGLGPVRSWQLCLTGGGTSLERTVLWQLRAPRVLVAMLSGAALATSGLVLQVVVGNPLAAPESTGVSSGAVLGVMVAVSGGLTAATATVGPLVAAAVGGLAGGATLAMCALVRHAEPDVLAVRGVIAAAAAGGIVTLLLAFDPTRFGNATRWLIGTVDGRVWAQVLPVAVWTLLWCVITWLASGVLDVLSAGTEHAQAMGLGPVTARVGLLLPALALAAGAVALAGPIGFVGLAVPLVARRYGGGQARVAVVLSVLLGGCAVVGADVTAHVLTTAISTAANSQRLGVPTGAVTAVLGAAGLLLVALRRVPQ